MSCNRKTTTKPYLTIIFNSARSRKTENIIFRTPSGVDPRKTVFYTFSRAFRRYNSATLQRTQLLPKMKYLTRRN